MKSRHARGKVACNLSASVECPKPEGKWAGWPQHFSLKANPAIRVAMPPAMRYFQRLNWRLILSEDCKTGVAFVSGCGAR